MLHLCGDDGAWTYPLVYVMLEEYDKNILNIITL